MPAVALTDHGSLAGAVELYREAGKHGVKPLIGCEVYVADDRRAQRKGYAHLTLLAENNAGYGNLIKLASAGYLEGYYYKPRVDWELLERHAGGLIAPSRSASAATSSSSSERSGCRSSRSRTAATRSSTWSSCARKACKSATAAPLPICRSASASSSRRSGRWASSTTS